MQNHCVEASGGPAALCRAFGPAHPRLRGKGPVPASRRPARGFTLIEIMVVLLVLGILMAGIAQLLQAINRHTLASDRSLRAQEDARIAVEGVVTLLQTASPRGLRAADGWSGAHLTVTLPQWDPGQGLVAERVGGAWQVVNRDALVVIGRSAEEPTVLEVVELGPKDTVVNRRVLCRSLAPDEDTNGNGVLDAGEDLNGDGRLQRGVLFTISDEDRNADDTFEHGEDRNRNGLWDCLVTVRVDTFIRDPHGPAHGATSIVTQVRLGNV